MRLTAALFALGFAAWLWKLEVAEREAKRIARTKEIEAFEQRLSRNRSESKFWRMMKAIERRGEALRKAKAA